MREQRFTKDTPAASALLCAMALALAMGLASCASTKQVSPDEPRSQEAAASKESSSSKRRGAKKGEPALPARAGISRNIADEGIKDAGQLYAFFLETNPYADKAQVSRLARYYVEESRAEGINSDCAFVQMCLETGFLQFGNLVTADMHNYCGLGATGPDNRGVSFDTERLGVRAHVQHLHAYATTEDKQLKRELVDPRYKYVVPRGKSPTIAGLSRTWAADPDYSIKLEQLLVRLEAF